MPTTVTQLILFFSSYAPLFWILAARRTLPASIPPWTIVAFGVASVAFLFLYLRAAQRLAPTTITAVRVAATDGDSMSYIVTYLIPFLDLDFTGQGGLVPLVVLFGTLAVLYVNSNMLFTNPMLNLAGYHTFEVEDSDGQVSILLTRRQTIPAKREISVVALGAYMSLEKER